MHEFARTGELKELLYRQEVRQGSRKAVDKLPEAYVKQVLNHLAASKLRRGLLVNFGSDE